MDTIRQLAQKKVKSINKQLDKTKIIACNMFYITGNKPAAYCELYNKSNKKRIKVNLLTDINIDELINNLKN